MFNEDGKNLVEEMTNAVNQPAQDGSTQGENAADNGAYDTVHPPLGDQSSDQDTPMPPAGTSDNNNTTASNFKNLSLVGYETLFVHDGNLQRLSHLVGLPTLPPSYGKFKTDLDSSILYNADLVRYNLGKFFYRYSGSGKYEFLNTNLQALDNKHIEINKDISTDRFEASVFYNFADMGNQIASYTDSKLTSFIISIPQGGLEEKTNYLAPITLSSFPPDAWRDFVEDLNIHKLGLGTHNANGYYDFPFVFLHPYDSITSDELGVVKVLYTNLESNYNFHQPAYESIFSSPVDNEIPLELYLPNFNVILAEKNNPINSSQMDNVENVSVDRNYATHTTLNNRLEGNILRALEKTDPAYDGVSHGRSGNEYYETWGDVFGKKSLEITGDPVLKDTCKKFRNVIFPLEALKTDDINITKGSFPFYNEVTFNTDTNTQVADILKIAGLFDVLVAYYIQSSKAPKSFYTYQEEQIIDNNVASGEKTWATGFPHDLNVCDFDLFVQYAIELVSGNTSFLSNTISNAQDKAISISSEEFFDDDINLLQVNPLTALIKKIKFLSLYDTLTKSKARGFKDIMRGKTCYNETLFYRIEKRDMDGTFIQNFYVLNDSQLIDANIIDTQVVYGKEYQYTIFAIQFVLGNLYNYKDNPTIRNPDEGRPRFEVEVDVQYRTSARLVEIPYVKPKKTVVHESPPLAPIVDFVPYRNNDREVLIMFQNGTGDIVLRPDAIKKTDFPAIQSTPKEKSGGVRFKSEGDVSAFELYRISENTMPNGPASLFDFGNPGLSKKVTLSAADGNPSYLDNISPNTKYWYIFRSLDEKHVDTLEAMNFSNPTNIFELQAINNEGAIYFVLNTYDHDHFYYLNKKLRDLNKSATSFRKYLRLKPNFGQSIIDEKTDTGGLDLNNEQIQNSLKEYVEDTLNNDTKTIKLGVKKESVFGFDENNTNSSYNQFKIRLVSKKTGRKLDIFTRFKKPILQK